MRERISGAGLVLVAALASAAPASAAGRADMEVARAAAEDVSASCDATGCNIRLTASARVVNHGAKRAGRARIGFFLSQDARRDGGDRPPAASGSRPSAADTGAACTRCSSPRLQPPAATG